MSTSKQGLVFVIASLTQSVNASTGALQGFYYGEAADGKRNRMSVRIGENQVTNLLAQIYGENNDKTANALIGHKISCNVKGYATKVVDGVEVPEAGVFVIDSYVGKDGEKVMLAKTRFIAGGLLTYIGAFNDMLHEMMDFGSLPVETEKPVAVTTKGLVVGAPAKRKGAALASEDAA